MMKKILTQDEIQVSSGKLKKLFAELKKRFTSRDKILDMYMYALMMREHFLVFGPPGTSKTMIGTTVMGQITGKEQFTVQLTRFTTEDALIGPYNIKKLREEGIQEHNVDGMLPEAHYAFLGEFLDGSEPTLRSLLTALNEREMRKGRQILEMPLHTAFCDTNTDPYTFLQRFPNAFAVLDRLMFINKVDYLSKPEEIAEMVENYQTGRTKEITTTISHEELNDLSRVIINPPSLFSDPLIFGYYAQAVHRYRIERLELIKNLEQNYNAEKSRGSTISMSTILPNISDRRINKASQMMEVSAVLNGRMLIEPDDMLLCGEVFCNSPEEWEIWNRLCGEQVDIYSKLIATKTGSADMHLLKNIDDTLRGINFDTQDINDIIQTIKGCESQLASVSARTQEASGKKNELGNILVGLNEQAKERLYIFTK